MTGGDEAALILAFETSCDDCSVAVVRGDGYVLSELTTTQFIHNQYRGIVPEVASREHFEFIDHIYPECMKRAGVKPADLSAIAVTTRPGLMGSLWMGINTAKTLSLLWNKPLIDLNHMEGHIYAPFLYDEKLNQSDVEDPSKLNFVALTVSGGHTNLYNVQGFPNYEVLGQTLDDAAGEAFDKLAVMLGLPFPGGAWVDRFARLSHQNTQLFTRSLIHEDNFLFSFSGLKSQAMRHLQGLNPQTRAKFESEVARFGKEQAAFSGFISDVCREFENAVCDILVHKTIKAVRKQGHHHLVVSGGVAANTQLREKFTEICNTEKISLHIPPLRYCTDQAAMMGLVGHYRLRRKEFAGFDLKPEPRAPLGHAPDMRGPKALV